MDVLCTHPMFGPDSGKGSWQGLNFMYETVRVGDDPQRQARIDNFLRVGAASWGVGWVEVLYVGQRKAPSRLSAPLI
jgi:hypothetical protein